MPEDHSLPASRRLSTLLAADPLRMGWACLRAAAELARARLMLVRLTARQIAALNSQADIAEQMAAPEQDILHKVQLVADTVPHIAPWLPWRADCLVQAIAAQHWLASHGLASQIVIGADKTIEAGFEAHAWLRRGEQIITGGVVSRYTTLLDPGAEHR